jgi:peptide/nickel transport system permease protein
MAAEVIGARKSRILFRHLIPNAVSSIIVASTLGLANAVIMESYVSFLGLGVQPPTATWGNMMTDATTFIQRGLWWMWVVPGFFIVYTIICFNLVGDGLRDALDPKNTKRSS